MSFCLFCAWFCGNDTGYIAVVLDYNMKLGMLMIHHYLELVCVVFFVCFFHVLLSVCPLGLMCSPG